MLSGRVKESLGKTDLTSAYVVTYDSLGNVSDSIKCDKGGKYYMGEIVKTSLFWFKVPRVDSTYVFDVVCDRYQTKTVTFTVNKIGHREESRSCLTARNSLTAITTWCLRIYVHMTSHVD